MEKAVISKWKRYMRAEIERSLARLKLPGHPKPYFLSYLLRDTVHTNIWGRYGSLCVDNQVHKRLCFNDLRVGSYRYDQVTQGGLEEDNSEEESYDLRFFPLEDGEDAARFALWRLTDAKYREAVSLYHRRRSQDVNYVDENRELPSLKRQAPEKKTVLKQVEAIDREYWRDLIRRVSRVMKPFAHIKSSYVDFEAQVSTKIFVSSEGVERVWNETIYSLSVNLWFHHRKIDLEKTLVFHRARLCELPSESELRAAIKREIDYLYAMEQSEEMGSYSGPVLLSPKAAGLLFHEVLGHRLEGSRLLSNKEGRTFQGKIGQQIIHPHLSVSDDPSRKSFQGISLVGSYPFDDEGSPGMRSVLIENGILKSFLNTRAPLNGRRHQANGHARNETVERPISRMANLIVESSEGWDWAELRDKLIEEVRQRGLAFGIILLDVEGGETGTEAYDFQAFLGQITKALKVYPDGREVLIRGIDFVGTPLVSLSQIVAVGRELEVDNSFCGAESGTIPVSTIAPAVLLSNLELQSKDSSKITEYILPLPWVPSSGDAPVVGQRRSKRSSRA